MEAVGIRSINNIVDLTNFLMLETGQPFHAFDYDKILGQKMILRQSKQGEKVITLDDMERILDDGMLIVEDEKRLIDLVGIMGGKLSEIDSKTKNIVLQAGNFDRKTIYRTTKKLDQSTDASNIYIQGIDPNLTTSALERAYFLLEKLGGGKIIQIIDVYPKRVFPKRIKLDLDYIESLLGIKMPQKEIKNILQRLDFKYYENTSCSALVEVPTRRIDISLPEDLIEEIGRIYGYQKIPTIFPVSSLVPPKRNEEIFWEDITKNILKEAGLTEVYNYSFISEKDVKLFGFRNLIELENPLSEEQKFLQPSLIPNLLKNIQKNQEHFNEIRIFELGKVFESTPKQSLKDATGQAKIEKRMLSGLLTGDMFYQVKGIIDLLIGKLGISDICYDEYRTASEEAKISWWHSFKCAEIRISGEQIGFLGEISPRILESFKIKSKLVYFDIVFEKLLKIASEEHEYRPISKFPAAIRDIAILVPREIRIEEVLNVIEIAGGSLVRDVDLFDIYEGEQLPEGKKNLAFHIIYQAEDRTLSSKEIDEIQNKIIRTLEKNPEWQVRN